MQYIASIGGGRYSDILVHRSICNLCDTNEVESEYNFLFSLAPDTGAYARSFAL